MVLRVAAACALFSVVSTLRELHMDPPKNAKEANASFQRHPAKFKPCTDGCQDLPGAQQIERFTSVLGATVKQASGSRVGGSQARRGSITLVTSLFVRSEQGRNEHPHVQETFAALAVNTNNPAISSIHVLLQAPDRVGCSILADKARNATGRDLLDLRKVQCVRVKNQPTYADFFEYANRTVVNGSAMIVNADVVFDESLGLLEDMKPGRDVTVLTVVPPPYEGQFADIFRKPCFHNKNWCTPETMSWDAFVFTPPLPATLPVAKLRFYMNIITAEHRAAGAMASVGFKIKNPCFHVKAYHWHCFSEKTHAEFPVGLEIWPDDPEYTYPCRDYPEDC